MWTQNKVLQYPINIKCPNPKLAKFIISQYGGPDGELAASLRYLSQRFGMPDQKSKAILNDIGTEECVPFCCQQLKTTITTLTIDCRIEKYLVKFVVKLRFESPQCTKVHFRLSCSFAQNLPQIFSNLICIFRYVEFQGIYVIQNWQGLKLFLQTFLFSNM